MPQQKAWENEYQKPKLLTKSEKPRSDLVRFMKFLRKTENVRAEGLRVLDLGSGTGRNGNYLAQMGSKVIGLDISRSAVDVANARAKEMQVDAEYVVADIGNPYDISYGSIDLVIDVMSSNTLNEAERETYLSETARVLKPGGYFFVRGLLKDGDKNTKKLLEKFPGREKDTYVNEKLDLVERVFAEDDFRRMYGEYFDILKFIKKSNYALFQGRSYKRNYFVGYLKKKKDPQ